MQTGVDNFNASASMAGYFYQVRTALLWAVQRSHTGNFTVNIEVLDDVSFESDGDPVAVLQTKHSLNSLATLSDLSPELWKTLRVWLVGLASGEVPLESARILITTAQTITGSACSYLEADPTIRNVAQASELLKHAALTSKNTELQDVFQGYLALSDSERLQLLSRVIVVPAQPNADAIFISLQTELYYVSLTHLDAAIGLLEGWWLRRVIYELVNNGSGIKKSEIDAKISDIQESLKTDSLPIDGEIDALLVVLEQLPEFASRPFYKQIELVGGSRTRIRHAITSYLQAFRQRSMWTRDDLLFNADLQAYDSRLVNEWELQRAQVFDELGEQATEDAMTTAGRAILKWAEDAPIPIRPGVNVPWVCRGSLHMLADDMQVGWHPQFLERMKAIFEAIDDKVIL